MAGTIHRPHPSPVGGAAPHSHSASLPLPSARGAGLVLCHPHPYLGGHRDNPLMRNLARRLARDGVTVLRFDFRGVGDSGGKRTWMRDGETDDVVAAARRLSETRGVDPRRVYVCGYSFGSAVALSALDESTPSEVRVGVASWGARSMLVPARGKSSSAKPKLFLVASDDVVRVGDARDARAHAAALPAPRETVVVEGADHAWRGRHRELHAEISSWIARRAEDLLAAETDTTTSQSVSTPSTPESSVHGEDRRRASGLRLRSGSGTGTPPRRRASDHDEEALRRSAAKIALARSRRAPGPPGATPGASPGTSALGTPWMTDDEGNGTGNTTKNRRRGPARLRRRGTVARCGLDRPRDAMTTSAEGARRARRWVSRTRTRTGPGPVGGERRETVDSPGLGIGTRAVGGAVGGARARGGDDGSALDGSALEPVVDVVAVAVADVELVESLRARDRERLERSTVAPRRETEPRGRVPEQQSQQPTEYPQEDELVRVASGIAGGFDEGRETRASRVGGVRRGGSDGRVQKRESSHAHRIPKRGQGGDGGESVRGGGEETRAVGGDHGGGAAHRRHEVPRAKGESFPKRGQGGDRRQQIRQFRQRRYRPPREIHRQERTRGTRVGDARARGPSPVPVRPPRRRSVPSAEPGRRGRRGRRRSRLGKRF